MMAIPRLRMFAGPNGSGKTTVKVQLNRPPEWFGIDINPDILEAAIRKSGCLATQPFELSTTTSELRDFFRKSTLLQKHLRSDTIDKFEVTRSRIVFPQDGFDSYFASVLSDFLRRKALTARKSFTFETVMSAPDKVELLKEAQSCGYRTYLYFIATEDPSINIQRVRNRVADGGHDVPVEKIISRYARSLSLLAPAIQKTNRAFLFDTSREEPLFFAEITDGKTIDFRSQESPHWFGSIWNQISSSVRSE